LIGLFIIIIKDSKIYWYWLWWSRKKNKYSLDILWKKRKWSFKKS